MTAIAKNSQEEERVHKPVIRSLTAVITDVAEPVGRGGAVPPPEHWADARVCPYRLQPVLNPDWDQHVGNRTNRSGKDSSDR